MTLDLAVGPRSALTLDLAELWTRAAAAAADHRSITELGVPSAVLMERAALACVAVITRVRDGRPVHLLCGPGNNGGDGVAIARILHLRGVSVHLHLLAERCGPGLAEQLALAERLGVAVQRGLPPPLLGPAVVVDAMLGTGAAPPLREPYLAAVAWANAAEATRVAVDLPTGIDADTGAVPGPAVRADLTVTFERSKPGLHLTPARAFVGELTVASIGLVDAGATSRIRLIAPAEVRTWICALPPGAHKGQRGHLGVLGGSAGTPGAAVLCGAAALRAGAGLVTIVSSDPEVQAQLIAHRPELMVTRRADPPVPRADALVVGPGLTNELERRGLAGLYADDPRPAVWDASALGEIAGAEVGGPRVLTPHPAEAARLLSLQTGEPWTAQQVQGQRVAAARALAAYTGAIVVLKGEGTVIAGADRVAIALSGGPALATAGTGDCLAGLIGALLARGLDAWTAACAGVHLHGVAGELLAAERRGAVALELADAIGRAVAEPPAAHPRWPDHYAG